MTQLWYRESGLEEGPSVVFLHGLFASMQNWQGIVKRLVHDFHVFNVDLPNHGNSLHTEAVDYMDMRDRVIQLLDSEDVPTPVNLVGHSMGGKVAMMVALARPDLVSKLLVEDMAPKEYPQWFAPIIYSLINVNLSKYKSRLEVDDALAPEITDANLRMFLMTNLVRAEDKSFRWRVNLDAMVKGGPSIAGFPDVSGQNTLPMLVVRGSLSPYVDEGDLPLFQKYFPNAELKTVVGANHWVHARDAEAFLGHLLGFLGR
jgi:esterase